jgi:hypothetical protein
LIRGKKLLVRRTASITIIIIFVICITSFAGEKSNRNGFGVGLDAGIGQIKLTSNDMEKKDTNFFLGFEIGYVINPHFLTGIELSGWLYEPTEINNPFKGEGLNQVFLMTRFYPSTKHPCFTKIGGGYISHWNNNVNRTRRKNGLGISVGVGYDIQIRENWSFSPFLSISLGEEENQKHKALSLVAGITWY